MGEHSGRGWGTVMAEWVWPSASSTSLVLPWWLLSVVLVMVLVAVIVYFKYFRKDDRQGRISLLHAMVAGLTVVPAAAGGASFLPPAAYPWLVGAVLGGIIVLLALDRVLAYLQTRRGPFGPSEVFQELAELVIVDHMTKGFSLDKIAMETKHDVAALKKTRFVVTWMHAVLKQHNVP